MSLITHALPIDQSASTETLKNLIQEIKIRLENSTNLTLPLAETLEILEQLSQFDLGRFLLFNRGLSGYWTSYVILSSYRKKSLHPLEDWLINKAPTFLATQERFRIFQQEIQLCLRSNMRITSIPCGLMDDLLSLDYTGLEDIEIFGIDLDLESLKSARDNVKNYSIRNKTHFLQKDAWDLGMDQQFDLITSNGLNIYEPNDDKVTDLCKEFYKALRPSGILVTSFLTPPPTLNSDSPWKFLDPACLAIQKTIFLDILQVKWQAFRTEGQTRRQLEKAGFKNIAFTYDHKQIFPTVVAKKN